jgi:hypothetical protein
LAVSSDLKSWKSLAVHEPMFISRHASRSLRYMDAQLMGNEACIFYEFARPDGAHDLRLAKVKLDAMPFAKINGSATKASPPM